MESNNSLDGDYPASKKLKILHISNNYKPYSGGLVTAIDSYLLGLESLGHETKLITIDFEGKEIDAKNIHRIFCPIKFKFRKKPIAIPFFCSIQIKRIINQFNPDIIHIHHPFLLGYCAAKISHNLKIPTIFTHHTIYEHYLHHVPINKKIASIVLQKLLKRFYKLIDHVIVPTKSTGQQLLAKGFQKHFNIFATGISKIFELENLEIKKKSTKLKLLYVGRFEPEKNLDFLLNVFSLLEKDLFELTLAGFGSIENKLIEYEKKFEGSLKLILRPSKEEIKKLYVSSDLFVFASFSETQGLVLAESMACGTPIVALNAPGSKDIIQDGYNGFLINNENEMIEKIRLLNSDISLHKELQRNAFTTGKKYHEAEKSTALEKIYLKIINHYQKINSF